MIVYSQNICTPHMVLWVTGMTHHWYKHFLHTDSLGNKHTHMRTIVSMCRSHFSLYHSHEPQFATYKSVASVRKERSILIPKSFDWTKVFVVQEKESSILLVNFYQNKNSVKKQRCTLSVKYTRRTLAYIWHLKMNKTTYFYKNII